MASAEVLRQITVGGTTLSQKESVTGAVRVILDEYTVADGQTDQEQVVAIDVSEVQAFFIKSDQNVTLETNDGATPGNTINLLAGKAYLFVVNDYNNFLLTTDVTSLLFTNASGSTATISCESIET